MRTVKIEQLKNTVKTIKGKNDIAPMNTTGEKDKLPEHPPFTFLPGMVNGKGEQLPQEIEQ
jgi:hypothetical protein